MFKFLNNVQKKIILLDKKNILILAGAGSGKTKTLVYKIAWSIKYKKINPSSILVVTFTNKAANEIKFRINKILNNNIKMNWIGTFHSLSYQILKLNYKELNFNNNFQIIDNNDQIKILNDILKKEGIKNKNFTSKNILKIINSLKEKNSFNMFNNYTNNNNSLIRNIYNKYEKLCLNLNLLDFSSIITKSYYLLKNSYKILEKYRNKFKLLFIDEFQDTNIIQYKWIKLFKFINNFIIAVGDDDQSIYSWRGTNINNIKNFRKNLKNTITFYLERNYRSTNNIVQASNNLIINNKHRSKKKLWTKNESGELISVYIVNNEENEANIVIKKILKIKNYKNIKIAILYRKNLQSKIIEKHLILNNIKYRIYGGIKFLDKKEIRNCIYYIRLIINLNDNIALENIINFPSRKIGKKTIETIKNISNKFNLSYWKSIIYIINNINNKNIINKLKNFTDLILNIKSNIINYPIYLQIYKISKYSGIWDFYNLEDKKNNNIFSKLDNIIYFIKSSKKYFIKNKNKINLLKEFITNILIQYDIDFNRKDEEINLMTIHSSKGLEFDIVFILGLEEGNFPTKKSIKNINLLEEERRLAYVGFTRAMKKLILIFSKTRYVNGKIIINKISRFIKEIPKKYLKIFKI